MHQKARTQELLCRHDTQHNRRHSIIGRVVPLLTMAGSTANHKSTDWTDRLFTTLDGFMGPFHWNRLPYGREAVSQAR